MRKFLPAAALLLSSCVNFPNDYAPTRARQVDLGPSTRGLTTYIDMKDPASLAHLAWGMKPGAFDGERRRANPQAALRFHVPNPTNLRFHIDFDSPVEQTIRFRLNARLLGETTAQGRIEFTAPVEPSDFVPGAAALVEIESTAGLFLYRAGFLAR
jgi:hypothetical protein